MTQCAPFIDTNLIIRFLTNDHPEHSAAAAHLFEQMAVGALTVRAPELVIFEAVFVLMSPRLYNVPRPQVRALLTPLINLPSFELPHGRRLLRALDFFLELPIKFGDAYIAATMEQEGATEIYSFDRHFDRIKGIRRIEPPAPEKQVA